MIIKPTQNPLFLQELVLPFIPFAERGLYYTADVVQFIEQNMPECYESFVNIERPQAYKYVMVTKTIFFMNLEMNERL